jgi:hypothetical protein
MALADAGWQVEAVCPSGHPLNKTDVAQKTYPYRGLLPLSSFSNAIAAANPDLIVSADDLATWHLHELLYRERRQGRTHSSLHNLILRSLGQAEGFPVAYSRAALMKLAAEEGVRAPKTTVIRNQNELRLWTAQTGFPAVLKADGTSGGDGVRIVHTMAEAECALKVLASPPVLARAAKRALINGDQTLVWPSVLRRRSVVNAQEFIAGREATSALACWQGKVVGALHFEVLNKRNSTGPATVLRLIQHVEMAAAAERIARRLNLSGFHGLDFMLEGHSGDPYLVEMNPRATQVGHLTLGPGRDLPGALYAAALGQAPRPPQQLTEKTEIALFPHEWLRDPASEYLRSAYHDVPWEQPGLVRAGISTRRPRPAWYSRKDNVAALAAARGTHQIVTSKDSR